MLGPDAPAFFACYAQPGRRGLRVNTLRLSPQAFAALSPFGLRPGGILPEGFILEDAAQGIGAHPYHLAGMFYLQEPSALAAVAALEVRPGMRVLDLCAAPGGKSGAIAAQLAGQGLLVSNEIVAGRAKTLRSTLERLGVTNAAVTQAHPDDLCAALPGYFDAVLVDAPCSGEGMFRKDPAAVKEWSPAHVRACAGRQYSILCSAAGAVAPGGALVYSTCTFSVEENEAVVERFCAAHPAFALRFTRRLYPHTGPGEGHFVARLVRQDGGAPAACGPMRLPLCKSAAYAAFAADTLRVPPAGEIVQLPDGRVFALPLPLPGALKDRVRLLSAGVYCGDILQERFRPAHALSMAAGVAFYTELKPEAAQLHRFLTGETIPCDTNLRGWARVLTENFPLGFGKMVQGTLKNHLPKGLRNVFAYREEK
jgi:16S rRNA C967 or C1407 C5-methylase (RsmB/RsmF family)/NOL1/NOP2/fmu family ribosome biogenesis protein